MDNNKSMIEFNLRTDIEEFALDYNEEALLTDDMDEAFLGMVKTFEGNWVACYDTEKCIELLMKDNMTREEAIEYFEFNVSGAYVGENTPAFICLFEKEDA